MRDSPGACRSIGWPSSRSSHHSCPSPPPRPRYDVSRGHLHRGSVAIGTAGSMPSSRAPADRMATRAGRPTSCARRIVALHVELTAGGLDAGPVTRAWRISSARAGRPPRARPSGASCRPAGLVGPRAAQAAPRRSRGTASRPAQPNELWQSDFTHWRLADGSEVKICSLARRPRPLPARLHRLPAGGPATTWWPPSRRPARPTAGQPPTLTDNGAAVPTRRASPAAATGSSTLTHLGIRQKNGMLPAIPRRQGEFERFHQTLERRSLRQPAAVTGRRAAGPARRLRARLQRAAAAPGDRPAGRPARHTGDAQGAARGLGCPGPVPSAL